MKTFLLIYASVITLNIIAIEIVLLTPLIKSAIKRIRERNKQMILNGEYIILPSNF